MMNTSPNQKPSNPGSRSRKIVFLYLLTVLILIAGVLEAGFRVYHYRKYGEWKSAADIFNQHVYLGASSREACSFLARTFPDPYLVYVRRNLPHCDDIVNNIGIVHNKDITYKKSSDIYKLLVTGGSVAEQYARYPRSGPSLLEATLNRCYIPPNGKQRFGVWSGAIAGWRQPQQPVFTLLYGREFDGVLSLEGYNEHRLYNNSKIRFDNRRRQFSVLPLGFTDFGSQVKIWAIGKIIDLPLIRHSHVFAWFGSVAYYNRHRGLRVHAGYYSYPQEWRVEDIAAQNKQTYLHHIRSFYHIAVGFGLDFALFIQPVPAIQKPLTKQEKAVVGDLSYKESYLEMSRRILELNREGILTISLLDAFQHIAHSIYWDPIHFRWDPVHYRETDAGKQPGNEILNRKIVAHLAKNWGFQRRPDAPDSCPAGPV